MPSSLTYRDWLQQLPKVELHVHLEGAIPYDSLWQLIGKYGGDPSVPDPVALRERLAYRDFPHFIETWLWKNEFLREYEDFSFIAEAAAREFAQQNIRYAEAFFSPRDFARHGLKIQRLAEAIRSGLSRVPSVEVALIVDLIRDFGPEAAAESLHEVDEVRDQGVIGIGIGGSEQHFPPEPFAQVYESARRLGLRTTAHAGEAAGAGSVWGAVGSLRVDRIGHGTRAREDDGLVEYLAEQRTPIELCPISNVRTGVIGSVFDHPAKQYLDRGLLVCINTDDPKMFHNSLTDEFLTLRHELGMTPQDVRQLIVNGVTASWMDDWRKRELIDEFRRDPVWNLEPVD